MKIAVIGNSDECLGFSLAGAIPFEVNEDKYFNKVTKNILNDQDTGIVIITDRFYDIFTKDFSKDLQKSALPSVVFVPSMDKKYLKPDLKEFLSNVLGIKL